MVTEERRTPPLNRPAKWCLWVGTLLVFVNGWMGSALVFGDPPGANALRFIVPVGLVLGFALLMLAVYLQHRFYKPQNPKVEPHAGLPTDDAGRPHTRLVGRLVRWCRGVGTLLIVLNVVVGGALVVWHPSNAHTLVLQVPIGLAFGVFLVAFGRYFDDRYQRSPPPRGG